MSYIFSNAAAAMRRAAKATYTYRVKFAGNTGTLELQQGRTIKWIEAYQPAGGTLSMGTAPAGTDLIDVNPVDDQQLPIEVGFPAIANTTIYFTLSNPLGVGFIDVYAF